MPSYIEGFPKVISEALARLKPIIIFEDIKYVINGRQGIFVCNRNEKSLRENIDYILLEDILDIDGFAQKSAQQFIKYLPKFIEFLDNNPAIKLAPVVELESLDEDNEQIPAEILEHELYREKIVVTGFTLKTNPEIADIFSKYSIENSSSVSKKCWGVIVKDPDSNSGKRKKADKLGLNVYSIDEFIEMYG